MAAQFISTILDVYSDESNGNLSEFCIGLTTFQLVSPALKLKCTCQDDGAAWRRKYDPNTRTWINKSELLFSLEVKSSYSQSDGSGMGVLSNWTLAQQFCELLGSVMSKVEHGNYEALSDDQRHCFLVSVHQTEMMIIACDFSLEYLDYIYSQENLDPLPYVVLKQSRKYDLSDPMDRVEAAKAIIAVAEYLEDIA